MVAIEVNWKDNPWWNKTLDAERHDREHFPDTYENIWEGAHQTAVAGSYYGHLVGRAREDGRITKLGSTHYFRSSCISTSAIRTQRPLGLCNS
jgi:hypothetical protein